MNLSNMKDCGALAQAAAYPALPIPLVDLQSLDLLAQNPRPDGSKLTMWNVSLPISVPFDLSSLKSFSAMLLLRSAEIGKAIPAG